MNSESTDRALVLVKPDGVIRGLQWRILELYENEHLLVSSVALVQLTIGDVERLFPHDESWVEKAGAMAISANPALAGRVPSQLGRSIASRVREYLCMAPVLGAILVGDDAPRRARVLAGATSPRMAAPGTIRWSFSNDDYDRAIAEERPCLNVVHASEPQDAKAEVDVFLAIARCQAGREIPLLAHPQLLAWLDAIEGPRWNGRKAWAYPSTRQLPVTASRHEMHVPSEAVVAPARAAGEY